MNKIYFVTFLIVFSSCKRNAVDNSFISASFINFTIFKVDRIKIDSTFINAHPSIDLRTFYKKYNYETVWNTKEHRDFIINEISNAESEGLQPTDYNVGILKTFEDNFDTLPDSLLITYDLQLTTNSQLYIKHIIAGKLDPVQLYKDWDLVEKNTDPNFILFDCIDNDNFENAIAEAKPQHLVYQKLKNALKILNQKPNVFNGWIDIREKIVPNKNNSFVPIVKKQLIFWGDLKEKDTILSKMYDKKTQEAVKIFQKRHGLKPDGVIGKSTIEALNFTRNQRIEQVILNMERWRWFAKDFGNHYLLINIPDYTIVAIKENDTMQFQKVVVGKDSRKTPILESKISNINLNPNWTVPPTILKEDVYPFAEKDRSIFRKKGLVIMNNKNQEINPYSWKKADANKYKYIQKPGRNNSLGSMKINFPNNHAVYLHDTNHRSYFAFTYRALSSGCVRLEKPLEMAAHILNDTTKWSLKKIQDTTDIKHYFKIQKEKEIALEKKNAKLVAKNPTLIIEKKKFSKPQLKTIVIKVPNDIFVHQLYWTAWENNGILQFREDIYCLDAQLYSKLRN
jgi:murein L,D-transpeptidase YcbB/YkuD